MFELINLPKTDKIWNNRIDLPFQVIRDDSPCYITIDWEKYILEYRTLNEEELAWKNGYDFLQYKWLHPFKRVLIQQMRNVRLSVSVCVDLRDDLIMNKDKFKKNTVKFYILYNEKILKKRCDKLLNEKYIFHFATRNIRIIREILLYIAMDKFWIANRDITWDLKKNWKEIKLDFFDKDAWIEDALTFDPEYKNFNINTYQNYSIFPEALDIDKDIVEKFLLDLFEDSNYEKHFDKLESSLENTFWFSKEIWQNLSKKTLNTLFNNENVSNKSLIFNFATYTDENKLSFDLSMNKIFSIILSENIWDENRLYSEKKVWLQSSRLRMYWHNRIRRPLRNIEQFMKELLWNKGKETNFYISDETYYKMLEVIKYSDEKNVEGLWIEILLYFLKMTDNIENQEKLLKFLLEKDNIILFWKIKKIFESDDNYLKPVIIINDDFVLNHAEELISSCMKYILLDESKSHRSYELYATINYILEKYQSYWKSNDVTYLMKELAIFQNNIKSLTDNNKSFTKLSEEILNLKNIQFKPKNFIYSFRYNYLKVFNKNKLEELEEEYTTETKEFKDKKKEVIENLNKIKKDLNQNLEGLDKFINSISNNKVEDINKLKEKSIIKSIEVLKKYKEQIKNEKVLETLETLIWENEKLNSYVGVSLEKKDIVTNNFKNLKQAIGERFIPLIKTNIVLIDNL